MIAAPALEMEAQWVARRILELRATCEFQDIAVLVRNTEVIAAFTEAFDAAGIPYVVNRGRGFYESREVNDLVHLLRVIANPQRRNQPRGGAALAAGGRERRGPAAPEDDAAATSGIGLTRLRRAGRTSRRFASGCANGACAAST